MGLRGAMSQCQSGVCKGEGGVGCHQGASPDSSWAPTRQWLAFQDFELGRTPARFISEGRREWKREDRWSQKAFQALPRKSGMDKIFEIKKKQLACTGLQESLLLMKERMDGDIK